MNMSVYWRKDRKCWAYEFQHKKQSCRGSGFQTKKAAARAEAEARDLLRSGKFRISIPTFRELAIDYLKKLNTYHTGAWASQVHWKLNRYFKPLFDLDADTTTAGAIQRILLNLNGQKKPATLNEYRKILNAIFNLGIRNNLINDNPIKYLPPFPEDDTPKYIPPALDFVKVLQVATPDQKAQLLFMKNTMCRIGAIRNVTWSDVNFEERWVMLKTRKKRGGSERRWKVPINSELLKVLTELKLRSTSEYIFPTKDNNHQRQYPRYLRGLCKKAGVKPFTFHCIRHFAATVAANRNSPLTAIQTILGHEDIATTSIYLQSLDETVRSTAESLVGQGDFSEKVLTKSSPEPDQD
jgi:integrase